MQNKHLKKKIENCFTGKHFKIYYTSCIIYMPT